MTTRASGACCAAEPPDEAPDARVPAGETGVVDQVLPDRRRIAPDGQCRDDPLAIGLARARLRRARRRWPRARRGVGGHLRGNGRFCRAFARSSAPAHGHAARLSDRRWPFRDGRRSPVQCAAATSPGGRARRLAARLLVSKTFPMPTEEHGLRVAVNVSVDGLRKWPVLRCRSMAGFGCPPRRLVGVSRE